MNASRIQRPDGTDPEGFYWRVATAYGQYAAETNAPARAIADEAEVPLTTAHRWVREARLRGYLPPGEKGRADDAQRSIQRAVERLLRVDLVLGGGAEPLIKQLSDGTPEAARAARILLGRRA